MMLTIRLGQKSDIKWAQSVVEAHHYLRQKVHYQARPHVYVIELAYGEPLGLIMVGLPHATRNKLWWGYEGLITKWQVVDLCRIWLDPKVQAGGYYALSPGVVPGFRDRKGVFRPTVASWAIRKVLSRIQQDRIALWPPVYPDEPYHIRLVISYHDPLYHKGTIYRLTNAQPMYTDETGNPIPAKSGKFGWVWQLPQPNWVWQDLPIITSRQLRLAL